jgi:histone acetyltransferase (RNA polymerase elongator complex component)
MFSVWKYPIPCEDNIKIAMPRGAQLLSVQAQGGEEPCLRALVQTDAEPVERRFRLAGTGHPIKSVEGLNFVGTFQMRGGALVFHLFEVVA